MKAFIDRVFKKRKKDAEQIEENKAILSEQIETSIKEVVEKIEVELKQTEDFKKPGHYFADCNCAKCVRWRWINQNAE
jgi:hypothetical protein